ncbi:MAG TPA: hypothetical protein VEF03_07855, partial [Candidatus Binataceae bacterium]|nr:hypothetical protein [Candidatus Binataceae bacterium]
MAEKSKFVRLLRWLTILLALSGFISTLSFATGAEIAVRYLSPAFGAWWDTNEFTIMAWSASALGMVVAIRSGARVVQPLSARRTAVALALAIAAVLLIPVADAVAKLGRMGWDADGGTIARWLIARLDYEVGTFLDKVVIAGVYFLKMAAFAMLAGLGIVSASVVVSLVAGKF